MLRIIPQLHMRRPARNIQENRNRNPQHRARPQPQPPAQLVRRMNIRHKHPRQHRRQQHHPQGLYRPQERHMRLKMIPQRHDAPNPQTTHQHRKRRNAQYQQLCCAMLRRRPEIPPIHKQHHNEHQPWQHRQQPIRNHQINRNTCFQLRNPKRLKQQPRNRRPQKHLGAPPGNPPAPGQSDRQHHRNNQRHQIENRAQHPGLTHRYRALLPREQINPRQRCIRIRIHRRHQRACGNHHKRRGNKQPKLLKRTPPQRTPHRRP